MAAAPDWLADLRAPEFLQQCGKSHGITWSIKGDIIVLKNGRKEWHQKIPDWYLANQYDFVLYFLEKDRERALEFKKKVESLGVTMVTGITFDDPILCWIQSANSRADEACDRSTVMLIYISENVDRADESEKNQQEMKDFEKHRDTILYKVISDKSKYDRLIPIYTKSKSKFKKLPYGIGQLDGINLNQRDDITEKHLKILFKQRRSERGIRERRQNEAFISHVNAQVEKILAGDLGDSDAGSPISPDESLDGLTLTPKLSDTAIRKKTKESPGQNRKAQNIVYNINNSKVVTIGDDTKMIINERTAGSSAPSSEDEGEDEDPQQHRLSREGVHVMHDEATENTERVQIFGQDRSDHDYDDGNLMKHALAEGSNHDHTLLQEAHSVPSYDCGNRSLTMHSLAAATNQDQTLQKKTQDTSSVQMQASLDQQSEAGLIVQPIRELNLHADELGLHNLEDSISMNTIVTVNSSPSNSLETGDTGLLHEDRCNGHTSDATVVAGSDTVSSPNNVSLSSQVSEDCESSSSPKVPAEGTPV